VKLPTLEVVSRRIHLFRPLHVGFPKAVETFEPAFWPISHFWQSSPFCLSGPHYSATLLIGMWHDHVLRGGGGLKWLWHAGLPRPRAYLSFSPLHKARIDTWLHPEADPSGDGYQILQSLRHRFGGAHWAWARGRADRKPLSPEAHNDSFSPSSARSWASSGRPLYHPFRHTHLRGFVMPFGPRPVFHFSCRGHHHLSALQVLINIRGDQFQPVTRDAACPFSAYGGTRPSYAAV
jgi:hypothetical protein